MNCVICSLAVTILKKSIIKGIIGIERIICKTKNRIETHFCSFQHLMKSLSMKKRSIISHCKSNNKTVLNCLKTQIEFIFEKYAIFVYFTIA